MQQRKQQATLVVLLVLGFVSLGCANRAPALQHQEQTQFAAEGEVEKPVDLPDEVLRELMNDERNQTCLGINETKEQMPASWFAASQIHLNGDRLPDLVVTPKNACLFGANMVPFWVFRSTNQGYKLALSMSGLALQVLNSKTNGYRDIETSAVVQTRYVVTLTFKFDGSQYKQTGRREEEIHE